MHSKKTFSFNEEKDAESIIEFGFPNGAVDYVKMYVVAKYFRTKMNYGAIRLEKEIIAFCKAQDTNFNPIIEAEAIKKWIKSALAYNLRKIDSISISEKDINFLNSIENLRDRKLLFVTLILSKALKQRNTRKKKEGYKTSENYYIRYNNFSDIIRLAGTKNIREIDLADMFYKYKEHLTIYNPEKELIKLNFVDANPESEIVINDLNNLSEHYNSLFEKKKEKKETIRNCIICGKEIIKKSNRQKTCGNPECAKAQAREKQKLLMRKRRAENVRI